MFKYFRLSSLLVLIFVPLISFGAPAMRGVAVNEITKECGGYWGGDEFKQYFLPFGWAAYYPIKGLDDGSIKVGDREIEFREIKFNGTSADFCEKIGYNYVGENIGELAAAGEEESSILYIIGGAVLIGGMFFMMKIFRKKKV